MLLVLLRCVPDSELHICPHTVNARFDLDILLAPAAPVIIDLQQDLS